MAKEKKAKASDLDKESSAPKMDVQLREAIEEIKKKFGEGSIMKLHEMQAVDVDVVSTGCFSLDTILGVKGLPRGRMIEIYGDESSGKTTLALHCVAQAQKNGGVAAYIDAEHAMDPAYAGKIGVKVDDLLISQPDSGEEALQIVEALTRSEKVDVIVVDSVAALIPKNEVAGEIGDTTIGLQARLMSQAMRKLASVVARTKTILIFLNQTRMKIGVMFGNPETTPGGMALKFYASVRINLKRIAQIKHGEEIIGSRIKMKIVKNKVAAPFRTAEVDIFFNEGISKSADLLNLGLKNEIIKKVGNTFNYEDKKLGTGVEQARKFIKEDAALMEELEKKLKEIPEMTV